MARFSLDSDSVPTVNPSGAVNTRERIDATPEAFGAGIGRALGTLGQGIDKASDVGFKIEETQDAIDARTHASELHSWQSDQVTDAQEKYLSLKGRAALEALPEFKQQIDDIHQQARQQAGNPYTAQLVDAEGRRLTDVSYAGAARHAATERKSWEAKTAADNSLDAGNRAAFLASQSPVAAINDDLTVQQQLLRSDLEVQNLAEGQGYESGAIDAEVAKNRGKNVKSIVELLAADGSPTGVKRAFDFYKAQEEKIDAGSRVAIQNALKGPLNQIAGQKVADEVLGRPPQKTPPEIVADVPANFVGAVKATEGFSAQAKWDVKQNSNGFGTKANYPGEVIDVATANARFNKAFAAAAKTVDSVNPNLDPGTRAALSSLTYNAGEDWVNSGLGAAVRAGDLAKAKELFLQYNKAGGETNDGLVARRAREASWFGRGDLSSAEVAAPRINRGDAMLRIMDDPNLQSRPQVQAAALAHLSKVYQAWDLQSTQDAAAFKLRLQNSTAEALDTGSVRNPLGHEEFIAGMGAGDGEKAYGEYMKNVQLGSDIRSTAQLSPEDLAALREKYKPVPGDEFVAQQERQASLDKAIARNEKSKAEDPANFLIQRTDFGTQLYHQFQTQLGDKAATPEMKTTYASLFADKMLAEQTRLGIPPEQRRVVPKFYTDDIVNKLTGADANGGASVVAATLQQQAKLWGDHWPDVYRQIAPSAEPIVRVLGAGVQPWAAMKLINGQNVKEADLLKNQDNPDQKLKDITKAVDENLRDFFHSLSGSQRDLTVTDFRNLGTKLATLYLGDSEVSGDVGKAAKKAADDIVNFKYDFKDKYRIPKDQQMDPDLVQAGAVEARRLLGAPDAGVNLAVAPKVDRAFPGRGDLAEDTAERARNNGVWMTDPHEKGLMLFQPDGTAVRKPDGSPLALSWQQLSELGKARSAGRSAGLNKALEDSHSAGMSLQ